MTFTRLLLRNLRFHWRGNFAVLLGVAVGTAVLTGALLVGDSLRGSLRDVSEQRVGWIDYAMIRNRFFDQRLLTATWSAPAIILQGSATTAPWPFGDRMSRRSGRVTILGVDREFWKVGQFRQYGGSLSEYIPPEKEEVILNGALAHDLGVGSGQFVVLHLPTVGKMPRETLLGRRESTEVVSELRLKVKEVLPDERFGSRFSLYSNVVVPRNAFVPRQLLQKQLDQPEAINALLVKFHAPLSVLQERLHDSLSLKDWGLVLHDRKNYLSLESRQMYLEPAVVSAALATAKELELRAAPTLVYLANTISDGKNEIPYSVIAALDPSLPPPLGSFLPKGTNKLNDDEIILADWKDSWLKAKPGDPITISYFRPEDGGGLAEVKHTFKLRGTIPLEGVAADPKLTPEFPGITDKLTIRDWNPPFPYENKRIKARDEKYWREYRTTPKAYVNLATGQKLWGSRFGNVTSIRLAPASGGRQPPDLKKVAEDFSKSLLAHLKPEDGGFVFDNVRERGLEASEGGTDFRWYFLYFSFFLIAAALLLVGLLFRLNLDRRASEIGVLLATGFRRSTLRWLLLAEGGSLAVVGGLVGLLGALGYAWLLLVLLAKLWPGVLDQSFLRLHATWQSLAIGYFAALVVSILTITWAVRVLGKVSPRALLSGETTAESDPGHVARPPRWSPRIAIVSALVALVLLVIGGRVQDHEMQALSFFGGGALLLTAGLCAIWAWMRREPRHPVTRSPGHPVTVSGLGVRNASRHPTRSLLTAGLLASAAFLIVAVESFRRHADPKSLDPQSGNGGFALMAESDLPIFQDLNSEKGRDELIDTIERQYRQQPKATNEEIKKALGEAEDLLKNTRFYPFRRRDGDDASCLNLYQPRRPRLLGAPHSLIDQNRFQFSQTETKRDSPWQLLEENRDDGVIPVFADATAAEYVLKKKLGDELELPNERGESRKLRIVGLLKDSVFQGELLLSEAHFLELYPSHEGYNYFLIDTPPERTRDVESVLGTALADRGFDLTRTADKLESFLAVENTYLSTFQVLGAFGLLLGALGLSVVLVRSIWERRGELALLRALGFRERRLGWLVLSENGFLLVLGLITGTVAALLSVAPHLSAGEGQVPWLRLAGMLSLVLIVGLLAGAAAVATTLRAPLLPALRRE